MDACSLPASSGARVDWRTFASTPSRSAHVAALPVAVNSARAEAGTPAAAVRRASKGSAKRADCREVG